jgi:hypothetical protein
VTRAGGLGSCLALLAALASDGCDPVHDNAKGALGGEVAGIPPGPLHRAGQPCLVCHDGAPGDPSALSIAGTLFVDANLASPQPEPGATVTLVDARGTTATATTNAAGNFFLAPSAFSPTFPVHVTSITKGAASITMHSHIGGDGSCARCHADPAGPDSPGHLYFEVAGTSP